MIHFVVALRAEARPIIEHFRLQGEADRAPFRVYQGREARLVVSGVGRVAAAGATAYLATQCPGSDITWLNVGIAGHRTLDLGQPVLAREIVEAASGKRWSPPLIDKGGLPCATVCTVDKMATDLSDERLYEMEAAGFYGTAVRWTRSELVRVLKVVSDRGEEAEETFDRGRVTGLIAAALESVERQVEVLRELAATVPD